LGKKSVQKGEKKKKLTGRRTRGPNQSKTKPNKNGLRKKKKKPRKGEKGQMRATQ